MGLFKKNVDVPDELPDLAVNEVKEVLKKEFKREINETPRLEKSENSITAVKEYLNKNEADSAVKTLFENHNEASSNQGFFNDLLKNLNEEISDLSKLESWYNSKILPQDTVSNMKQYWEGQKSGTIVKIVGKDYKEKLISMISNLHNLEKEWQGIYFNLVEKEEAIRKEERELKKVLSDFVDACKNIEADTNKSPGGV